MKVTLESTMKIVGLNGIPARIWEGETESGIKVHAFITRIAVGKEEDHVQFEKELEKQSTPSAEMEAYPIRLII